MRLRKIRVTNFRGIEDVTIEFGDLTIISGKNESGKTSIIDAFDYLIDLKANSTKAELRASRPIGKDVGPEVEAEIELGGHTFVYRKRWLKDRETTLRFTAGPLAPTSLTGDEAHNKVAELWEGIDQTLWRASRIMAGQSLDQHDLTASGSLRRALENVTGTAVDEESVPLLEKVEAERARYYTASGKETKELLQARKDHDECHEELDRAAADLADLTGLVDKLVGLDIEIERRTETLAQARHNLAEIEEQASTARSLKDSLDKAAAHLATVSRDESEAVQAEAARTQLIADVDQATAELAALNERVASLSTEDLDTRIDTLTGERETAVPEADRTRLAYEEGLQVLADQSTRVRRSQLADTLAKVAKVSAELEAIDVPDVDESVLPKVDRLEREIATARAVRDASATILTIEKLGSTDILINGDVTDGPLPVSDLTTVEVPGHARLTLTPPADSSLDKLEEDMTQVLSEAGATSADELRTLVDTRTTARAEQSRLNTRLADLLGEKTRSELEAELEAIGDIEVDERQIDIDKLRAERDEAATRLADITASLEALKEEKAKHGLSKAEATGKLEAQQKATDRLTTRLASAREEATDEALADAATRAHAAVVTAQAEFDEARSALAEAGGEGILDDLDTARQQVDTAAQALQSCDIDRSSTKAVLDSRRRDEIQERFDQLTSQAERVDAILAQTTERAEAAAYLYDVLLSHQQALHAHYAAPFRATLESLASVAFDDPTLSVVVGSDLQVEGLERGGDLIPVDSLSMGAREQLALLIRLATAQLVAEDGVPLMFDDVLGHSDAGRLLKMTSVLNKLDLGQVMIFTANDDRFAGVRKAERVELPRR